MNRCITDLLVEARVYHHQPSLIFRSVMFYLHKFRLDSVVVGSSLNNDVVQVFQDLNFRLDDGNPSQDIRLDIRGDGVALEGILGRL